MAYRLYPPVGDRVIIHPDEDRGSKFGAFRGFTAGLLAEMGNLESGDSGATFEDILFPLLMALKGSVTPTQEDVTDDGDAYLWTFTPTSESADNPDTFTVEWGDDVQVWETEYCFGTGLSVSGAMNEALALSMPMVGRQHSTSSFTNLSDRTVESILMNKTVLKMDDVGGTLGDTAVSSAIVGFNWDLPEHFYPYFTGEGNEYFTAHAEKKVKPTLNLDVIMTSAVATIITTKYQAETNQLVRLESNGTLITSGGSLTNMLRLDGAYRIMNVSELQKDEGLTRVAISLAAEYDSTYAKMFEVAGRNSISTLP